MQPFRAYEVDALRILLAPEFTSDDLSRLLSSAAQPHIEYTGYGFYVSVSHPDIGKSRRVFSGTPDLHGRFGEHHVGFVAFLEDDQLTLETFPWDGEGLPKHFRESDVRLTHPQTI